ncbi:MAG: UDP-N-acetylmuramoyl-tripeptide--D-alanyl-D-alanine ligase [Acidimicrobiales bacterium]
MSVVAAVLLAILLALAYGAQMLRWLRVLQREHYDPQSLFRFLGRWTSPTSSGAKATRRARSRRPVTLSHLLVVAMVVAVFFHPEYVLVILCALYGLFTPWGLSIKGRTSPLEWTRRLRAVGALAFGISLLVSALGALSARPFLGAVVMVVAVPPVLDLSTRLLEPLERRKAQAFADQARRRLEQVAPRVVAITGSYGKTSTKNHLAAILSPDFVVVASPRSFNNRAGLSRAINENLADGTEIFIAEMGTYGPGELRDLASWIVPEVAIVTAIGPVHLERMKTLDVVEAAKREITERATTVVLNVDDPRLATWPASLRAEGKHVVTAGSQRDDVEIRVKVDSHRWTIVVEGKSVATLDEVVGVQPTNLACAIAGALALGASADSMEERVSRVGAVSNRLNVVSAASGVLVIDDTFNANPVSAVAALRVLSSLDIVGRHVVVTPGLVELGADQYGENLRLAQRVAALPAELVVVGRTNVVALIEGYEKAPTRFDTRDEAVNWVRNTLRPGDGVLYLNDLPDHYP